MEAPCRTTIAKPTQPRVAVLLKPCHNRFFPRELKTLVSAEIHAREDPSAGATLACAPEDAAAPRLLPRPRLPQTFQSVSGRWTIPLPPCGGARPPGSFGVF